MARMRGVRPPLIEKGEVALQASPCSGEAVVCVQIDLFVFDGAPQTFDEHVVTPAPAPVHTDLNPVRAEHIQKCCAGELRALIVTYSRKTWAG